MEKRHLNLVSSNRAPQKSAKPPFRTIYPVPDCDEHLVKKLREYADQVMDETESDFRYPNRMAYANQKPDNDVLRAISCISPHRALELSKELNLIAYPSASREVSIAAKSKLAEADYII
jgi:hypothetical protein